MKPKDFDGVNLIIGENQPEYLPLPAKHAKDAHGTIVTAWELTDEEVEHLKQTKTLYLRVLTFNQPLQPVHLTVFANEVGVNNPQLSEAAPRVNPEDDGC